MGVDGVFGISYTWSKAINYADNSDSGLTWNMDSMLQRNRAPSGFDRTHNFQMYGVYSLPFGKGRKMLTSGAANHIVGGWQVNGILTSMTGTAFNIASAGTSVNSQGNTQTADQVLPNVRILGGVGTGNSYFDPLAFAQVTDVRFGNTGRNIVRGPGVVNLDFSLFRDFQVRENWKLQFRAESFNLTNTPAFNNPGATVSNATRNPDGSIRALNGYSEITAAGAGRSIRFALKVYF
jgi:hypothetical protein